MNYEETLKYINNTPKFSKILGNDELLRLLHSLGNPQDSLSCIHIAGTNGKGSTASLTASALEKAGYRVGLFTSPFIEEFNERIQINGKNISDADLSLVATEVKEKIDALGLEISVFAQITAMAFLYFKRQMCDIVVLEAGLGGRLDATNVIKSPKAVVITKIGLDHTEWLGDTTEKIALEKCGIIKPSVPVFTTYNQEKSVIDVIKKSAEENGSKLFICKETDNKISLSGEFQKENAGICEVLLKELGVSDKDIKSGFLSARWPARFEFLKDNLVIDGGHNPDGIRALISSLDVLKKDVIFVVAMMEDKELGESARMIDAFSENVIVTQIDMPRCKKASELSACFTGAKVIEKPIDAVEYALSVSGENSLVCVCGSLYFAGEVRKAFNAK